MTRWFEVPGLVLREPWRGFEPQPRYRAYAAAHGRSPVGQLLHDEEVWPVGRMTGFVIWVLDQWNAWEAATGYVRGPGWGGHSDKDHAAFDAWLERARPDNRSESNVLEKKPSTA